MKMRFAVILTSLVVLCTTIGVTPASAATSAHRQRSGVSLWAPQNGGFQAFPYNQNDHQLFGWSFITQDYRHFVQFQGHRRAVEMKAKVASSYADTYDGYTHTNLPSGSRPYRDVGFGDSSSTPTYGFGAANTNFLAPNTVYFAQIGLTRPILHYTEYPVTVSITAASDAGDDALTSCVPSYGYCVFNDYGLTLIRGRQFMVSQMEHYELGWGSNYLYNQTFEEGLTGYAALSGNNKSVYCDGRGYKSNCYVQFNKGSNSVASIRQDVNFDVRATDNYTVESMVRCPTNEPACDMTIAYWGQLGGPDESRSQRVTLPNDGNWYLCRVDIDHGGASEFAYNHTRLRWEVYNNGSGNMDIDYTTLALPVQRYINTSGDPGPVPPPGPTCIRAGIYDVG